MSIELEVSGVHVDKKEPKTFEIHIKATSSCQDEALYLINQVKACIDEINRDSFRSPTLNRCC